MVGRITPGYEINDNPATTGRSLGYGANCPTCVEHYGADQSIWTQTGPETLKLQPTGPATSRAVPDFSQGTMLAYGADLPQAVTQFYPGFLKKEISLPVFGTMMVGTVAVAAVVTFFVVKYVKKKKNLNVLEDIYSADDSVWDKRKVKHGKRRGKDVALGRERRYREKPGARSDKEEYVVRDREGKFKDWVSIPRSIKADMRTNAITTTKPQYGGKGDLERYAASTPFEGRMEGEGDFFVNYGAGKKKSGKKRKVTHGSRHGEPVALGRERRWRQKSGGGKGKYMYVDRDRDGKFKDWVSIPRSIRADMARDAETITRPKYGNKGDLPFTHMKQDAKKDLEQGTDPSYVATKFGLSPSEMKKLGYGDFPIVDVVNQHMLYSSD